MIFNKTWTQLEAIDLCKKIEAICPVYGCHVALTGGLLYKEDSHRDCDILFYRIRQVHAIDEDKLWIALGKIGVVRTTSMSLGSLWCIKATYNGKKIDCLFPENQTGEYIKIP